MNSRPALSYGESVTGHPWPPAIERFAARHTIIFPYGLAVGLSLIALALALVLPTSENNPIFVFFIPAAALATWAGGWSAGLFSLLLFVMEAAYFLLPPLYSFRIASSALLVRLLTNVTVHGLVIFVVARLRAAEASNLRTLIEERALLDKEKHAEKALRESEERLRATFHGAGVGIVEVDAEFHCIGVNDRTCEILGYRREQLLGMTIQQLTAPEDRETTAQLDGMLCDGRYERFAADKRYLRSDGTPLWVHVTVSAVRDPQGRFVGAIGTVEDISEREQGKTVIQELNAALQQRNTELEAERARWHGVVQAIADEVWLCDTQGRLSLVNYPALTGLLGEGDLRESGSESSDKSQRVPHSELTASALQLPQKLRTEDLLAQVDILNPDGTPRPPEQFPLLRSLQGQIIRGEEIVRHRVTGKTRYRQFSSAPTRDASGNITGAVAIVRDITDQKHAEQALIRSEKLASVGRMAATVAHEINNPLAASINAIYLAATDPDLPERARGHLETAEKELERVGHITKQTLGFYRESGKPGAVQVPELIDGVLSLYGPKLKSKSVRVNREFCSTGPVRAIEGELRQVVANLVANSIDAIPERGTLRIRTSGPGRSDGAGGMVRLTIADTGHGISPENLRRIFDPFFTTKQSVGTGLGLWVTRELVRKHYGRIRVRSKPDRGTVFSIWLPAERRCLEPEESGDQVTA